jgi:peptidoglycan/xylan/chitin deacetylase (PgdA/CDA1 family)
MSMFPQPLKGPLKETLGSLSRRSGLLARLLRGKTLILTYHRVVGPGEGGNLEPGMFVEAPTFARHLDFLARHFRVISLEGFLSEPEHPEPRCVITFDDGWRDNHTHAFPALRRLGLPATVFLATGLIGSERWLWSDRAAHLAAGAWPERADLLWRLLGGPQGKTFGDREAFIAGVVAHLKGLGDVACEECLGRASHKLKVDFPRRRLFLDWNEVAEMAGGGISFGAHTVSHANLARLSGAGLAEELAAPLRATGVKMLPVLSYPYGAHNSEVVDAAREAGYVAALSTEAGVNDAATDPFMLRRVGLHQDVSRSAGLMAFHLLHQAMGR